MRRGVKRRSRIRKQMDEGRIKFRDWPEVYKQLKEDIRRSERITAKDLAVVINAKG